ncbi:MAG: DUF1292 domain-containing protein [Agathobacter sp.]|nr:DUF1292 domain-containing protein [Agathobacter sp.]MDY3888258.1 DUF1292 domain-containing protein [Agathobacter sp.]
MEKVTFYDDIEDTSVDFYVVEQTKLNGETYLLVTEDESEEAEAFILREVRSENDEITYEMVEDELEITALGKVFAELLDEDTDIQF